jgi:hypothetical protein
MLDPTFPDSKPLTPADAAVGRVGFTWRLTKRAFGKVIDVAHGGRYVKVQFSYAARGMHDRWMPCGDFFAHPEEASRRA